MCNASEAESEENLQNLLDSIEGLWNLSSPALVISAVGGEVDFTIPQKHIKAFRKDLVQLVETTGEQIKTIT